LVNALFTFPMRRPLVLTTESARHPFRRGLPHHVTKVEEEAPKKRSALGFFGLSYLGSFLVIYGFII
jgi:hypothetical protein